MRSFLFAMALLVLIAGQALAAGPKDYQVTGPVTDLTDDVITVEKGKEKWEISRNRDTKVDGDLKKGSRVTVHYKMTATSVDVKDSAKAKTDSKAKSSKTNNRGSRSCSRRRVLAPAIESRPRTVRRLVERCFSFPDSSASVD